MEFMENSCKMLLHDTYVISSNDTKNTFVHSPLFHSNLTFVLSLIGSLCNLLCFIRLIYLIDYTNSNRKSNKLLFSDSQYYFFIPLTLNEFLLCLSAVSSCLDEKYYSFLSKYHLCSSHAFLWKFTLHFTPLLTISILCRYHYLIKSCKHYSRTLNQLLCSNLSILLSIILSFAWSVDGLWIWGVTNVKDFNLALNNITSHSNETENLDARTVCYLQTNFNLTFTARLVHLIHADFLLLVLLHLLGLVLEIWLQCRVSCHSPLHSPSSTTAPPERQICLYVLYIFSLSTITSLPFFMFRVYEIIVDYSLSYSVSSEIFSGRLFAQILLSGAGCKSILCLILFCPFSRSFLTRNFWTCYIHCFPPKIIVEQNQSLTTKITQNRNNCELEDDSYALSIRRKSTNSIIIMDTSDNNSQHSHRYLFLT
ncbi:unnamed protein product [Didymodactylos carnosus]|uniref:Uncharacterized protein n=1 Tax=Didymodactylos carnosus TaxID=1234261 RepID=A0A813W1M6_9BILA|nr:unnamed protein product [Didymodactylos carnosus]CAF0848412.1 unnamed protein product [Didymodactylos carnosus]CAF3537263.1 unnamed protein product [Didymodactylos carnosus]CAF3636063.1 unnamed protein product [Didymodactylos carnosus]